MYLKLILLSAIKITLNFNTYANLSHDHKQRKHHKPISRYNIGTPENEPNDKGYYYFPTYYRTTQGKALFIFDPNFHAWTTYNAEGKRVNTGKEHLAEKITALALIVDAALLLAHSKSFPNKALTANHTSSQLKHTADSPCPIACISKQKVMLCMGHMKYLITPMLVMDAYL